MCKLYRSLQVHKRNLSMDALYCWGSESNSVPGTWTLPKFSLRSMSFTAASCELEALSHIMCLQVKSAALALQIALSRLMMKKVGRSVAHSKLHSIFEFMDRDR